MSLPRLALVVSLSMLAPAYGGDIDPFSPSTFELGAKAATLHAQGRAAEAEALCRRAAQTATNPTEGAHALVLLAGFLVDRGAVAEAEPLARRALKLAEKGAGGTDDAAVARALNVLADIKGAAGDAEGAERLLRRAQRAAEGPRGALAAQAAVVGRRGLVRLAQGRYPDAEAMLERSLDLAEEALGPDHPGLITVLQALGDCYRLRNRLDDAREVYERSLTLGERTLGTSHRDLLSSLVGLALVAERQDDPARARELYARAESIDGSVRTRVAKR